VFLKGGNVLKKTSAVSRFGEFPGDTGRTLESVSLEQTLKGIHVARRIRRINIQEKPQKKLECEETGSLLLIFSKGNKFVAEMKKQDTKN
jgi:hypothetical protein